MSVGLVSYARESPNQILLTTEKGIAYLEGRTLINEFWTRVENRIVNFSLVAANIILVIAFFIKDTETADAIKSLNKEMQNIEKGIKEKEIKISLQLDTTGFHKTDSFQGD